MIIWVKLVLNSQWNQFQIRDLLAKPKPVKPLSRRFWHWNRKWRSP